MTKSCHNTGRMRLISLNTWGGRAGREGLLGFFDTHKDTDIFCLQEIWNGGEHMEGKEAGGVSLSKIMYRVLEDIRGVLPDHTSYFRPHFGDWYGLAMFVKKDIEVLEEGEVFVYQEKGYMPEGDWGRHARNIQHVTFKTAHGERTIVNFHGMWTGGGKGDTDDRLVQSDKIGAFLKSLKNPYVLIRYFHLIP